MCQRETSAISQLRCAIWTLCGEGYTQAPFKSGIEMCETNYVDSDTVNFHQFSSFKLDTVSVLTRPHCLIGVLSRWAPDKNSTTVG